jgi:CDP-glucose 4,6-dehydratase
MTIKIGLGVTEKQIRWVAAIRSSKACTELLTQAYWKSFFSQRAQVGVATARAGNVVGGGDWAPDRLIPDLVRAIQNKTQITLRNPQATRPWQHVLDPLFGYVLLAEKLWADPQQYATAWNFGPSPYAHHSVGEICQQFINHWFHAAVAGQWLKIAPDLHKPEAQRLALDSTLARQQLGWRPCEGVDELLVWTIAWYQACLQGQNMSKMSIQQLQAYLERGLHNEISTSPVWAVST